MNAALSLVKRMTAGRRTLPGLPFTLGLTLAYLSVIVLLPIGAMLMKAGGMGFEEFWRATTGARALATYRVTLVSALEAVVFNAGAGLLFAWVLARYEFPGKKLMDAVIDLPFALPTAVAGVALTAAFAPNGWLGQVLVPLGVKVAHTQLGITVAMAFTSLPFIVRTLQPVIEELEDDVEEAGRVLGASEAQIFTRVLFPTILPAFLTGCTLAFARCLGEFGAIIFIAGNRPFETEITALLIYIRLEEYDYKSATAIATLVLAAAFVVMLSANLFQAWTQRYQEKG